MAYWYICLLSLGLMVSLAAADPLAPADNHTVNAAGASSLTNSTVVRSLTAPGNEPAGNGTGSLMRSAPEVAQSKQTSVRDDTQPKTTSVRDDVAECYTCDPYKDINKCKKLLPEMKSKCRKDQRFCHFVVGEYIENGNKDVLVFTGCDVAPAVKLEKVPYTVIHTTGSDKFPDCKNFTFNHEDAGGQTGINANLLISYNGESCTCNTGSGCNAYPDKLKKYIKTETVVVDVKPPGKPGNGQTALSNGIFFVGAAFLVLELLF